MKKFKWWGFKKQRNVLPITGGFLEAGMGGTTFHGKNGMKVFFPGIRFSTNMVAPHAAYQLGGVIYISVSWARRGFDLKAFAHEYGHFLQQQEWGILYYLFKVAIPSVFSAWFFPATHYLKSYEQDATFRGNRWLETYRDQQTDIG